MVTTTTLTGILPCVLMVSGKQKALQYIHANRMMPPSFFIQEDVLIVIMPDGEYSEK